MLNLDMLRLFARALFLTCPATVMAMAQQPTFSLEVTAINSQPLDKPTSDITVGPGDVITVKIFIRDWSPNGEPLRALQATIDSRSYDSGEAGTIQPLDYETTTLAQQENKANAFIDSDHPDYVFGGLKDIAVVDTISYGYRYLSVVVDRDLSPICPQDGSRYYCGTLNLRASDDASGTFVFGLAEAGGASTLRDPDNVPITPINFERLTISVVKGATVLRIVSSDPPSGAIDARQPPPGKMPDGGWSRVELTFNADTEGLAPADFTVEDGTADPPSVKELITNGSVVTLLLDRGVPGFRWTMITHNASGTGVRIGYLPGDVTNNGTLDGGDVFALIRGFKSTEPLPLYRSDINRSGSIDVGDALRLIDLLNEPDAYRASIR